MKAKTSHKQAKAAKKNFSGYFPDELLAKLKADAQRERRSLNGQLCYILERYYNMRGENDNERTMA